MKVLELLEAKSKVEIHPWALEFVSAIKAFRLDPTPGGAGSSDGQWVPFEKVNKAMTELDAAGFKRTGKVTNHVIYKSKESPKKGLTFTFDDEDARDEDKVIVNFWDLTLDEALNEARDPKLTYDEKKVKNILDKVTVKLEGSQSASMSRLINRYHRIDGAMKKMIEHRDKVNLELKGEAESLFDAQDEILTRVVETLSCTIMLSKAEKAANKEKKKKIDFEAIVKDLAAALPDLQQRIEELTTKYTTLETPTDTVSKLTVKPHVKEGLFDSVRGWGKRFLNSIKQWAASFDKNLDSIKTRIAAL
jgi:hypothetical protein